MKSTLTALVLFCIVAVYSVSNQAPKAWGDVQSLSHQAPVRTDMAQWWAKNKPYGVNWTDFEGNIVKGINWNCITTSNGSNHWTDACYIGS